MKIALIHDYFDVTHLAEVSAQMRVMGAPTIHAVWMEVYGAWVALEGCHRLRAAQALGLVPEIVEVEYSDLQVADVCGGLDDDMTVARVCDDAWRSTILNFEE